MLDTTKEYFFGVATDTPPGPKKRVTCPHAVDDLVYYYAPGERIGKISTVNGWHYDENGNVIVSITIGATGEEIDAPLGRVRC